MSDLERCDMEIAEAMANMAGRVSPSDYVWLTDWQAERGLILSELGEDEDEDEDMDEDDLSDDESDEWDEDDEDEDEE